jgi:cytochrome c peroxidase
MSFTLRSALTLILPLSTLMIPTTQLWAADANGLPDPARFQQWRLPAHPAEPIDNIGSPERVALGQALFFDTRLSGNGTVACGTCHDPAKGWSDGHATARGMGGKVLGRATPTVINAAYNSLQMWDGRFPSLEAQALGPMKSADEMNSAITAMGDFLMSDPGYRSAFAAAYPGEPVIPETAAKAIAVFERTVVVNDTPFDRWLAGDHAAMSVAQQRGFAIFVDPARGNCEVCHSAPNFTDNGFHNIGLASSAASDADPGRFRQKPVASMKGAFKTPSLRDVARTAPYFHDGSAPTLSDVVEHYARGGDVKTNLSPNLKPLQLSEQDKADLVAFLGALTGEGMVSRGLIQTAVPAGVKQAGR